MRQFGDCPYATTVNDAKIMLVEDRDDDIVIIDRALARAKLPPALYLARDGEEAIQYLNGDLQFADRKKYPLPDLILLDLNMPRVNGFEVLRWLRQRPQFAQTIVVVLSNSDQLRDVNEAYKLGANSFLIKPHDFQNVTELGRLLKEYWFLGSRAKTKPV
jgi:CheY-like chemotaxis protein